jgi:hypothetical protein
MMLKRPISTPDSTFPKKIKLFGKEIIISTPTPQPQVLNLEVTLANDKLTTPLDNKIIFFNADKKMLTTNEKNQEKVDSKLSCF